jgi:periplasmic divalent cation tolerance protein
MHELLDVVTTVGGEADAERIARALVERRLAACVQAEAVRSCYRWKGRIELESEVRLVIKTVRARHAALVAALREMHPYELPAIHATPVAEAQPDFAAWVAESCREQGGS